jgi:hypothetical protein
VNPSASFWGELKRRNVFRVAAAYAIVGYGREIRVYGR